MAEGHSAAEQDNPKILIIVAVIIVSIVSVISIVIGVQQFYEFSIRGQMQKVELDTTDSRLLQLRAVEKHDLGTPQWIDQKAGILRIPVDDAVALTLGEWKARPGGTVAGSIGATAPWTPPAGTPVTPPASGEMPQGTALAPAAQPQHK